MEPSKSKVGRRYEGYNKLVSNLLPKITTNQQSSSFKLVSPNGNRVTSFAALHDLYFGKDQDEPKKYVPPHHEDKSKSESKIERKVVPKLEMQPYQDFLTIKERKLGNLVPYQAQMETLLQKQQWQERNHEFNRKKVQLCSKSVEHITCEYIRNQYLKPTIENILQTQEKINKIPKLTFKRSLQGDDRFLRQSPNKAPILNPEQAALDGLVLIDDSRAMKRRLSRFLDLEEHTLNIKQQIIAQSRAEAIKELSHSASAENCKTHLTYNSRGERIRQKSFFHPVEGQIVNLKTADIVENTNWKTAQLKQKVLYSGSLYYNQHFYLMEANKGDKNCTLKILEVDAKKQLSRVLGVPDFSKVTKRSDLYVHRNFVRRSDIPNVSQQTLSSKLIQKGIQRSKKHKSLSVSSVGIDSSTQPDSHIDVLE